MDMNGKYTEVITFHVRYGHGDDFRSAVARVAEARKKMNSPAHYSWHRLVNGGPGGTFVITYERANFASMADDPAIKPLRDDHSSTTDTCYHCVECGAQVDDKGLWSDLLD
jgi:hypothetical protein